MPQMTVADLMPSAGASADPVAEPVEDGMPIPGEEGEDDQMQAQTMQILVEEFRSAPIEEATSALEQMIRMIVRKYT